MTRQRAWILAAVVTLTVVLFVLGAGASFGLFGLGGSSASTNARAFSAQQSDPRQSDRTISTAQSSGAGDGQERDDDEGEEGEHEGSEGEFEGGDD